MRRHLRCSLCSCVSYTTHQKNQKQKKRQKTLLSPLQIRSLEESLLNGKCEYQQHQAPLNKMLLDLESELRKVRSQVERQVEINKDLLCVKMKLEAEINNYQQLIQGMTAGSER